MGLGVLGLGIKVVHFQNESNHGESDGKELGE